MRKIATIVCLVIFLAVLYLLFWPVPIDPVAWTPPEAPALEGIYAVNQYLAELETIPAGGAGPEDVAVDKDGTIYFGLEDGRIMKTDPDGSNLRVFIDTKGRPLGMDFDRNRNLIVADSHKHLMSISPDGKIAVLATQAEGISFRLVDDVEVGPDNTIYFSDASWKFGFDQVIHDLMEHRPNGRLMAFNRENNKTTVLLDDLYFANGVAVAPDNSFVLVNETGAYRTRRYWLSGPKKGTSDFFIENLPGFPDGISSNDQGLFWIALVSPRDPAVDKLLPRPFIRKIGMRLPEALRPAAKNYGFVLALDINGQVIHNLQDPSGSFGQITSVQEHGGYIYLGSLVEHEIGRLKKPL